MNLEEVNQFISDCKAELSKVDRNIFYKPIATAVISHDIFSIRIVGEGLKFSKYAFINSCGPDFKKGSEVVLIGTPKWESGTKIDFNHPAILTWYEKYDNFSYFNIEDKDYLGLPDDQAYGLIENIKVL